MERERENKGDFEIHHSLIVDNKKSKRIKFHFRFNSSQKPKLKIIGIKNETKRDMAESVCHMADALPQKTVIK